MSNTIYFYKDRPLFGMDIGSSSVKVMQLGKQNNTYEVLGYGYSTFDEACVEKGIIVEFEGIARTVKDTFSKSLTGTISTNRVALSVPAAYTFSRIINLPVDLDINDIPDAVLTETQQYLPSPINELYTDYSILGTEAKQRRILSVAVSQKIINSYMKLAQILGLEVIAMEPTTGASNRLFGFTDQHKVPSVLIDFGAISTDITIYDNNLVVTGTVDGGGDNYTSAITKALGVSPSEAHTIITKYGLNVSKKQSEIRTAIKPLTDELVKEIRRMVRYYEQRVTNQNKKIGQVVTLGGGANIPGLSDLLTDLLRLPVRPYDPWSTISFGKLNPPPVGEESVYITSAGLALIQPEEPFA